MESASEISERVSLKGQKLFGKACLWLAISGAVASAGALGPPIFTTLWASGRAVPAIPEVSGMLLTWSVIAFLSTFLACASTGMMQHATSHRVSSDAHVLTVPISDRLALQAVLDDLNAWIGEERRTWVSLQDSAGTTLREAMSLGVRLASFVSDSEKRFADSVDQSNQATNSSVTVLSRIVEAAERFEQGMPQLAQLIERHAHRQHEEDEACNRLSRLTEAAEAVTLALRDAGSSAVEQIEAMVTSQGA